MNFKFLLATLAPLTMLCLAIATAQITETKLLASDRGPWDYFGQSVSLSGKHALVGAFGDDDKGENAGAAYVFHYEGSSWVEQTKLFASDGEEHELFGKSVSLSGEYALIGGYGDSDNGPYSGSAYIFHYDGSSWVEQTKLIPSDGEEYADFGGSVSVSGDHMIVGAETDRGTRGSAYIFQHDGSNWVEQTKLKPSDVVRGDNFGWSVTISGDYALVGSRYDDDNGEWSGSVYVFHYEGRNWEEQTKLFASDGAPHDYFGFSLSLSGDYAIVGAAYDDNENGPDAGSAYIFHHDGSNWIEQTKLLASDGATGDSFGKSVSLSGEYALIGADDDGDNGANSGSAYIFHYDGSNWVEQTKLISSDGSSEDHFGVSVSLSSEYALIGAVYDDEDGEWTGSAYVYGGFGTPADPLAQYGTCYGSTGSAEPNNPGALITIDPLTGNGTLIGPTGIIGDTGPSVPALAIKSTGDGRRLYRRHGYF